jgi:hypothetical protein
MKLHPKPMRRALIGLGILLGALLIVQTIFPHQPIHAATQPAAPHAPAAQAADAAARPVDVVVVLDDSGSMAMCWPWPDDGLPFFPPCRFPSENLPSDPEELRYSAARLLVQLADADDRVAVVRFDAAAESVGALSSLQPIGPTEGRSVLANSLQAPTDYLRRGYTRLDLGLEQAIDLLQASREPGRDQYVLLLTDGEPTEPGSAGNQEDRIRTQIETLRTDGVFIFPVVLCNPSAGCSGEFLREAFAVYGVREAATASDLLRVFSEIFAEMKPDRSVLTGRGGPGTISLNTRPAHGVNRLSFVAPRGELLSVQRNGEPFLAQPSLEDPNIDVSVVSAFNVGSGMLPEGRWTAETGSGSGFAVVQSGSYPQLLNPPPSLADSPASTRYYPAGSTPLLVAQGVGPGAEEPLIYNGDTSMQSFADLRILQVEDAPNGEITLQLGEDDSPLQLIRSFRVEPAPGLPRAEVFAPTPNNPALTDDGRARLQVGFSTGANVSNAQARVYVTDVSSDVERDAAGNGPLVHSAQMNCSDRLCTDESFAPQDGRSYEILYLVEGRADEIRFGDWARAELTLAPAVYLRGLPATLDLAQMPADGWTVELSSGTTEEIGLLEADIELRRIGDGTGEPAEGADDGESAGTTEAGELVPDVAVAFAEDVPESGSVTVQLKVEGLDALRPGEYAGEITLRTSDPAGRPLDVQIRPSAVLPVTLNVLRPGAYLAEQPVDFGAVLFDTSPNFRLDQETLVPVRFEGDPFKLTAALQSSECADLTVTAGALQQRDGGWFLPLQLSSQEAVAPSTCTGALALSGPNADYDVFPAQLDWQVRVDEVEWSLASGELSLNDLRNPGERAEAILLMRFNGNTPFVVQATHLEASGRAQDGATAVLTPEELEFPPVEVRGAPNEDGLYEVPVALIARQAIPNDPLRGTFYSGEIELGILGLPDKSHAIGFNFRSPTLYQRYVAPIVTPIYSMPVALISWPLTLLMLLILVARLRSRDFDEDEWEEAAIASVAQTQMAAGVEPGGNFGQGALNGGAGSPLVSPAQADAAWGSATWGDGGWGSGNDDAASAWDDNPVAGGTETAYPENGSGSDPWRSGW